MLKSSVISQTPSRKFPFHPGRFDKVDDDSPASAPGISQLFGRPGHGDQGSSTGCNAEEAAPEWSVPIGDVFATASGRTVQLRDLPTDVLQAVLAHIDGDEGRPEWSEEDVVWLHWRLLSDLDRLSDPLTPLEEKLDTLAWVFSEPHLDSRPFSFVNCVRVVGTSPLSPTQYFGRLDVESIRDTIRFLARRWVRETIALYPKGIQQEVCKNLQWTARQLARNPQWINEQIKVHSQTNQADLFGLEGGK